MLVFYVRFFMLFNGNRPCFGAVIARCDEGTFVAPSLYLIIDRLNPIGRNIFKVEIYF
jgi:hypothetical protein